MGELRRDGRVDGDLGCNKQKKNVSGKKSALEKKSLALFSTVLFNNRQEYPLVELCG